MKYSIQNVAFFSAVIIASCQQPKAPNVNNQQNRIVETQPAQDTVKQPEDQSMKTATVQGFVLEINYGKDGYTARIETPSMRVVAVTISRSNLNDPSQFKEVRVGESLKVTGDSWRLGNEDQLTAREIN